MQTLLNNLMVNNTKIQMKMPQPCSTKSVPYPYQTLGFGSDSRSLAVTGSPASSQSIINRLVQKINASKSMSDTSIDTPEHVKIRTANMVDEMALAQRIHEI